MPTLVRRRFYSIAMATARPKQLDPGTEYRQWCENARAGDIPKLLAILPPQGEEEIWFGEQVTAAARDYASSQEEIDFLDVDGASPDFDAASLDGFLNSPSLFATRQVLIFSRAAKALTKYPRLSERLLEVAASSAGPEWMIVHTGASSAKGVKALMASRSKAVKKLRFRTLYSDPPPWRPEPDASEAAQFVSTEARLQNITMQRGAAGALVSLAGSRPSDLLQAINHFSLLGLSNVGEEDVREVASHSAEGSAFDFADAVLCGDSVSALRLLTKMARQGLRAWGGKRVSMRDAYALLMSAVNSELAKTSSIIEFMAHTPNIEKAIKAAGSRPSKPVISKMQKRLVTCDAAHLDCIRTAAIDAEKRLKIEGWRDAAKVIEVFVFSVLRKK